MIDQRFQKISFAVQWPAIILMVLNIVMNTLKLCKKQQEKTERKVQFLILCGEHPEFKNVQPSSIASVQKAQHG